MSSSYLASPSATIEVLSRHGLYTKKSLGQHFLVDDNAVARIIDLAGLNGDETVLEVGPGIGTLTVALCANAGAVVAVERDTALLPVLAETTADCPKLAIVNADAVAVTADELAAAFGSPVALVANLPYQVAATVVLRFFEMLPSLESATVMVQTEVANRMSARPGVKDYGSYTVKLRLYAEATGRFAVARNCFLPPPRVDSTVIRLQRRQTQTPQHILEMASRLADAAFAQRRKTIRNSMRATLGLSTERLEQAYSAVGIDGSCRAETLAPEVFLALAQELDNEL